ncbi:hypothetical protein OROMI_023664 [Orobanche minor]
MRRKLKAKLEYVRFLQDTTREMVRQILSSRSGDIKQTAEELDEFIDKVKRGATVSVKETMDFAKLFNNEVSFSKHLQVSGNHCTWSRCIFAFYGTRKTEALIFALENLPADEDSNKSTNPEIAEDSDESEMEDKCRKPIIRKTGKVVVHSSSSGSKQMGPSNDCGCSTSSVSKSKKLIDLNKDPEEDDDPIEHLLQIYLDHY